MRGRRGALAVALGAVGLGAFFVVAAFAVPGEAAYAGVGPRVVPILVGAGLALAGVAFGASVLRGAAFPGMEPAPDHGALVLVAGALALAVPLLPRAGFVLSAALLFTATARAFGSARFLKDAAVGLALAAVIYVAFTLGLGVALPGGVLEHALRRP